MSIEKAKTKLTDAAEKAFVKRKAYFEAKQRARKLEEKYEGVQDDELIDAKTRQRICEDWYRAERRAEAARTEATQADEAVEAAQKAYDVARGAVAK